MKALRLPPPEETKSEHASCVEAAGHSQPARRPGKSASQPAGLPVMFLAPECLSSFLGVEEDWDIISHYRTLSVMGHFRSWGAPGVLLGRARPLPFTPAPGGNKNSWLTLGGSWPANLSQPANQQAASRLASQLAAATKALGDFCTSPRNIF